MAFADLTDHEAVRAAMRQDDVNDHTPRVEGTAKTLDLRRQSLGHASFTLEAQHRHGCATFDTNRLLPERAGRLS